MTNSFKESIKRRVLSKHFGLDTIEEVEQLEKDVRKNAIKSQNDEIRTFDVDKCIDLAIEETINSVLRGIKRLNK